MADSETQRHWALVLRYIFAAGLCLLTVVAIQGGMQWYWSTWTFFMVFAAVAGQRRIFRPAINRTTNEIICRYAPWYEGNAYFGCLILPLMGISAIMAGHDPENPAWLTFVGVALLGVTPLAVFSIASMWRRCILRISPTALDIRLATLRPEMTSLQRDQVESITAMIVTSGRSRSLQTEIAYRPADTGNTETQTVMLGLQLTVKPINLANALRAWDDAAIDDPDELLDLIERILRSKSVSDVAPPQSRSALDALDDAPEGGADHG